MSREEKWVRAADEIFERVMGCKLRAMIGSDIEVLIANEYGLYPKLSASIGTRPGVLAAWPTINGVGRFTSHTAALLHSTSTVEHECIGQ